MAVYARLCGGVLANAHARSGDRIAIASYLGGGDRFRSGDGRLRAATPIRTNGLRGPARGRRLRPDQGRVRGGLSAPAGPPADRLAPMAEVDDGHAREIALKRLKAKRSFRGPAGDRGRGDRPDDRDLGAQRRWLLLADLGRLRPRHRLGFDRVAGVRSTSAPITEGEIQSEMDRLQ